jgi:hypothetical protein
MFLGASNSASSTFHKNADRIDSTSEGLKVPFQNITGVSVSVSFGYNCLLDAQPLCVPLDKMADSESVDSDFFSAADRRHASMKETSGPVLAKIKYR